MFAILMTLCLFASAFAAQEAPAERLFGWLIDMLLASFQQALGFSLSTLWETVLAIGGALYDQFMLVMYQLLFAGTAIWNQVTPIFTQLMTDIVNHVSDASIYIEQALAQIQMILLTGGKRENADELKGVIDMMLNALITTLGLNQVWDTILSVGGALLEQFMSILYQLLFVGQAVLNQVIPIFNQLAQDLMNHAYDAVPLITNALAQVTVLLG